MPNLLVLSSPIEGVPVTVHDPITDTDVEGITPFIVEGIETGLNITVTIAKSFNGWCFTQWADGTEINSVTLPMPAVGLQLTATYEQGVSMLPLTIIAIGILGFLYFITR